MKLSELTKFIKSYAQNPDVSDEEFLNAFLLPFIIAGNVRNKHLEEFHLNKSRTSRILNQKDDIPVNIRKALSIYRISNKTEAGMQDFIEDYLDPSQLNALTQELIKKSQQRSEIKSASKSETKEFLSKLLTDLLLDSLRESNISASDSLLIWKHGISSIEIQTGDLFRFGFENRNKKKNIVVIPVNTAFDTHITRKIENAPYPIVSENTIHGQWLIRMIKSGEQLDCIDARIEKSLKKNGFSPISSSKTGYGKTSCYPIGSVAVIEEENAVYFLIAIAQFDDFNNARSSHSEIDQAMQSLLNIYDRLGLGYDLYMPIMGTGLSRAGLSTQAAYDLLTKRLIHNSDKIHGHVHIIIRPDDRKEISINKEENSKNGLSN